MILFSRHIDLRTKEVTSHYLLPAMTGNDCTSWMAQVNKTIENLTPTYLSLVFTGKNTEQIYITGMREATTEDIDLALKLQEKECKQYVQSDLDSCLMIYKDLAKEANCPKEELKKYQDEISFLKEILKDPAKVLSYLTNKYPRNSVLHTFDLI